MSVVSSMVVTCEILEDEPGYGLLALNAWMARWSAARGRPLHQFHPLDVDSVPGSKGMENLVYASGVNYFDEDDLIEAFPTFPWAFPRQAILTIHGENETVKVVSGSGERMADTVNLSWE